MSPPRYGASPAAPASTWCTSVGQATFAGSLAALRRRGVLVSYGQSSGPVTGFEPAMLSQGGSLYLTAPRWPTTSPTATN